MITPTSYLFIDGAFLAGVCKSMADNVGTINNSIDIIDMRSLVSNYQRSFYYDCLPSKKKSEEDEDFKKRIHEKEREFRRFEIIPNLRVHSGLSRYRKTRNVMQQKGVDVLLAIEVFQHAVNGNMDEASIITGDMDFYPLFDALVQARVRTHLYYDPTATSPDLVYVADTSTPINVLTFSGWLKEEYRKTAFFEAFAGTPPEANFAEERAGTFKDARFVIGTDKITGQYIAYSEAESRWVRAKSEFTVLSYFYRDPITRPEF